MGRGSGSSGSGRRREDHGRNVSNASNVSNSSITPNVAPGTPHGTGGENIDRRVQTGIPSRESDTGPRPKSYAEGYQDGYRAGWAASNRRQRVYDLEDGAIDWSSYYGDQSRPGGAPRAGSRGASRGTTRGTTRGGGGHPSPFANREGPSTGEICAGEPLFHEDIPKDDAPKDDTSISGSPPSVSSEMLSSWEKIP